MSCLPKKPVGTKIVIFAGGELNPPETIAGKYHPDYPSDMKAYLNMLKRPWSQEKPLRHLRYFILPSKWVEEACAVKSVMKKIRVLHFVTGGFRRNQCGGGYHQLDTKPTSDIEKLIGASSKKTTTSEKLASLEKKGINYQLVINSPHFATSKQLQQIIKEWQPDILVAHGFPEHIIGEICRKKKANVPHMVQVEHNSKERYTFIKLWQTRHLSQFTDSVVAVSKGLQSP